MGLSGKIVHFKVSYHADCTQVNELGYSQRLRCKFANYGSVRVLTWVHIHLETGLALAPMGHLSHPSNFDFKNIKH